MSDDLRNKLASIALACSDYTTTDALDKITASLDRKAKRSAAQPPAAMPVPLQAGMDNAALTDAWCKKLPGVVPTERDLTAFALGAEVGFAHARDLDRQDWDRVHHALARHGKHPGRTDAHLADVIDRALAAAPTPQAQSVPATGAQPWQKPGPVTDVHPLECLIVIQSLRQSDGDWWARGDHFFSADSPLAWMPDTPENSALLTGASTTAPTGSATPQGDSNG